VIDLTYILRRAGEITRRHKALWLLGFLTSLGGVGLRLATGGGGGGRALLEHAPPQLQRLVADMGSGFYAASLVVGLALSLALMVLNALGQAGLVDQIRAAEERDAVDLRRGWEKGRERLWPVFLIRLLLSLPAVGAVLVGALPSLGAALLTVLMTTSQERPQIVIPGILALELTLFTCLLPTMGVAIALSIPLGVLQRLAVCACVLQGRDVRDSIARAWRTLRAHIGSLAALWMVSLLIALLVILLLGLPFLLLLIVAMATVWVTALFSPLLFAGATFALGIGAWLAVAAGGGVLATFNASVWTLAYRELTGMGLTGDPTETTSP
jgi:hypothetical protein